MNYKVVKWFAAALGLIGLSACGHLQREDVDKLNTMSYAYHYADLDSVLHYAQLAYDKAATDYDAGRAEALNNMAFADMAQMNYDAAEEKLEEAEQTTDNQVEKLVAYVQRMRLCQRMSANREFYEYRERAVACLNRINEERDHLTERLERRLVYAETEFAIINSTYYYYVGMENLSAEALAIIDPNGDILNDTAQYLNYLYNVGAGGIISENTQRATKQREREYLERCLDIARESGNLYFEANAMMAMADIGEGTDYAGNALMIFSRYGDVYQTAAAHRSLAACYTDEGNTENAFEHLRLALADTLIYQAPDLVASIYKEIARAMNESGDEAEAKDYVAMADEIQDETRRDRYYEAQAGLLDKSLGWLNVMIGVVAAAIIALMGILVAIYRLNKRNDKRHGTEQLLEPLCRWQEDYQRQIAQRNDYAEELKEQTLAAKTSLANEERKLMEHRARLTLVDNTISFTDRIIHQLDVVAREENAERKADTAREDGTETDMAREEIIYAKELCDRIGDYNDMLADWIKADCGTLGMRIESFALQDVLDVVAQSKSTFAMSGITLDIQQTDAIVKADKVLTLFMINTIADNARQHTPRGGHVVIRVETIDGTAALQTPNIVQGSTLNGGQGSTQNSCVEISISDTGCGMTLEQVENIFKRIAYKDRGFGLINCRGIIEKYKKTSRIFDVCTIAAESEVGKGSRFFFRLPLGIKPSHGTRMAHGIKRTLMALALIFSTITGSLAQSDISNSDTLHPSVAPHNIATQINESATNNIPTQIEESSTHDILVDNSADIVADSTLAEYCRTMQKIESDRTIAVVLLVMILLMILPLFYLLYYRRRLYVKQRIEQVGMINTTLLDDNPMDEKLNKIRKMASEDYPEPLMNIIENITNTLEEAAKQTAEDKTENDAAEDDLRCIEHKRNKLHVANSILDNCFSTLKHETMACPSRVRYMLEDQDVSIDDIKKTANYYRDLYYIFSLQARQQVQKNNMQVKTISINTFMPLQNKGVKVVYAGSETAGPSSADIETANNKEIKIMGNKEMLRFLFDTLKTAGVIDDSRSITASAHEGNYLTLSVPTTLDRDDVFMPSKENLPLLVCKQIVREHAEATNLFGCGIKVDTQNNCIDITLPRGRFAR